MALEPRRCEDIKEIVAPGRGPKSFGTFEKQAPGAPTGLSNEVSWENFVSREKKKIKNF